MNAKKKIVFITHDTGRTGAPLLLLAFIRLLHEKQEYDFFTITRGGKSKNDLFEEFEKVSTVLQWNSPQNFLGSRRLLIVFNYLLGKYFEKRHHKSIINSLKNQKVDLIISNTLTNGELLPHLKSLGVPIITYSHELELAVKVFTEPLYLQNILVHSDYFLTPSFASKEYLHNQHNVPYEKVEVLRSLLPNHALTYQRDEKRLEFLRQKLGIPEGSPVVGCIGSIDFRKGADIFMRLARRIHKKENENVYFLWVGRISNKEERFILEHDLKILNLKNIIFEATDDNPMDYLDLFDIFVLLSREDPYPLVILEAAYLKKPMIVFAEAGGAPEFIENDCGCIIDYMDLSEVAKAVIQLLANKERRKEMGEAAFKKVNKRHDPNIGVSQLIKIINRFTKK